MSAALKVSRTRMMEQVSNARTVSMLAGRNDLKTADSGPGVSGKRQAEEISPDDEAPTCTACAKKHLAIKEMEGALNKRNSIIVAYRVAHGRISEDRLPDRMGSKTLGAGGGRGRGNGRGNNDRGRGYGRGNSDRGRGRRRNSRGRGGGANEGERDGADADGGEHEG